MGCGVVSGRSFKRKVSGLRRLRLGSNLGHDEDEEFTETLLISCMEPGCDSGDDDFPKNPQSPLMPTRLGRLLKSKIHIRSR